MKGYNLRVKELRDSLVKTINESQLPITTTTMVIEQFLSTMKVAEADKIEAEQKAYEKELAEKESK